MGKLQNIIEGWRNYYFPNPEAEAIANERAAVCAICIHAQPSVITELIDSKPERISGMVCNVCTCPLSRKTRSINETCPENKWTR